MTIPRIAPVEPPYAPDVAEALAKMMPPGMEPLNLFRTLARNPRIGDRFRVLGSGILSRGAVDPLEREIVIHRTTARCGCAYEWGVHVVFFGRTVGLTEAQIAATVHGGPEDPAWTPRQSLLIRLADELHETSTVSDPLWSELAKHWSDEQLIELLVTAGFYHLVSYVANGARVEHETWAPLFPKRA